MPKNLRNICNRLEKYFETVKFPFLKEESKNFNIFDFSLENKEYMDFNTATKIDNSGLILNGWFKIERFVNGFEKSKHLEKLKLFV